MSTPIARPFAPDFDFTTAEIYLDESGTLCLFRDWNEYPAREIEVERLYLGWFTMASIVSSLAHHIGSGHIVVADGIDGLDELRVAQVLKTMNMLVSPGTDEANAGE
jgi:hypothetical protein